MTDIIVLLVIAVALFFCIRSIIRNKKRGISSCWRQSSAWPAAEPPEIPAAGTHPIQKK